MDRATSQEPVDAALLAGLLDDAVGRVRAANHATYRVVGPLPDFALVLEALHVLVRGLPQTVRFVAFTARCTHPAALRDDQGRPAAESVRAVAEVLDEVVRALDTASVRLGEARFYFGHLGVAPLPEPPRHGASGCRCT